MRQGTRPPGPLSWLHFISLADDFPFNIRGRILERFKANPYLKNNNSFRRLFRLWGPFLERQENFSGRRQILWSKPVAVWQFIAHKPVSFASLTDSFIMSFSELLEPWSWMQTRQTCCPWNTKQLFGAEKLSGLSRNRPQICECTLKMILKLVHSQEDLTHFLNGKKTLSFWKCLTGRRLTNYHLVWNLELGQTLF